MGRKVYLVAEVVLERGDGRVNVVGLDHDLVGDAVAGRVADLTAAVEASDLVQAQGIDVARVEIGLIVGIVAAVDHYLLLRMQHTTTQNQCSKTKPISLTCSFFWFCHSHCLILEASKLFYAISWQPVPLTVFMFW